MKIADQVATLEHDLADALAKVDALTAANEALSSQNKAVLGENATLQTKLTDAQDLVRITRSAADDLAHSALNLLKTSRRTLDGDVLTPQGQSATRPTSSSEVGRTESSQSDGSTASPTPTPKLTAAEKVDAAAYQMGVELSEQERFDAIDAIAQLQPDTVQHDSGDEQQPKKLIVATLTAEDEARLASLPPAAPVLPIGNFKPTLLATGKPVKGDDPLPIFLKRDAPYSGKQNGVMG